MGRLIRLDRAGHTTLGEWTAEDAGAQAAAVEAFSAELERGMIGSGALSEARRAAAS
jgi:hypothetical protein